MVEKKEFSLNSDDYLNINLIDETTSDKHVRHLFDGDVSINNFKVKRIKTKIETKDKLGTIKVRLDIGRNDYAIPPGLYAIGNPDENSLVLATANYKLTIDSLRKELEGLNLWILVLDTKGINVWCAAGKGTFGTKEMINRINKTHLKELLKSRTIILPQLGASSMIAHIVTKITGFKLIYGPVRAKDIKKFLENNFKATEEMRRVTFNMYERLVLTPIEFVHTLRYYPFVFILLIILNTIIGKSNIGKIINVSFLNSFAYLIAAFIGTIIFPILLPYLPFKMFSSKGSVLGILWSVVFCLASNKFLFSGDVINLLGHSLIMTTIVSYLSMNFTGSTTFTSFSGVQKETTVSVPIMIATSVVGLILVILGIII
ncbi:Corrinoid/iron-sulfur protein large subunit [Caloramator mitchellensis]|uniref:Corrinoid/iron-sulfur protein large subunit n=1 Tax=Caloramator mitchellensis TaxID=908809 RepID=A0A0R3JSA0_CALMK|nr:Corrinoid/iron-sulfur protein large subunit [Caloramator mitchellensis]